MCTSACNITTTFELLSLDGSSGLWRLTVSIDIGGQNSELIQFALCQVKDCIARGSNGDLSVHTLPGAAIKLTLGERDRGRGRLSSKTTITEDIRLLSNLVFFASPDPKTDVWFTHSFYFSANEIWFHLLNHSHWFRTHSPMFLCQWGLLNQDVNPFVSFLFRRLQALGSKAWFTVSHKERDDADFNSFYTVSQSELMRMINAMRLISSPSDVLPRRVPHFSL